MNAQQIEAKFELLKPNTMIRISSKPLYACLNNKQRAIKVWNSAGLDALGEVEIYAEDLYFATTDDYTIIILLNKKLESEFCQLASAAKTLIELSDNPEKHAKTLKNCFDAWV